MIKSFQKNDDGLKILGMREVLNDEGIETEIVHVGNKNIRGYIACRRCKQTGQCVFKDLVNEVSLKLAEADGIIIGSPVYYGKPNVQHTQFVNLIR